MAMRDPLPFLRYLDEPGQHLFVPSPRSKLECFACGEEQDRHPSTLEEAERRTREYRERERRGER